MTVHSIEERRDYTRELEKQLLWAYEEIERLGGKRPDQPPNGFPTQPNNAPAPTDHPTETGGVDDTG